MTFIEILAHLEERSSAYMTDWAYPEGTHISIQPFHTTKMFIIDEPGYHKTAFNPSYPAIKSENWQIFKE